MTAGSWHISFFGTCVDKVISLKDVLFIPVVHLMHENSMMTTLLGARVPTGHM